MGKLIVDESDRVAPDLIQSLAPGELARWIFDRLHGRDLLIPGGLRSDAMPHVLLAELYPMLDGPLRETLQFILLDFIRDLVADTSSEWDGEAGSELLMLIDPVFVDSPRQAEVVRLLLGLAGRSPRGSDGPDLRFRALQGLVALRHREADDFWTGVFRDGGDRYAPIVLEGLALGGPVKALNWLARVEWTDPIEVAALAFLPGLIEEIGEQEVDRFLAEIFPSLPRRGLSNLGQFAEDVGLNLAIEQFHRLSMPPPPGPTTVRGEGSAT